MRARDATLPHPYLVKSLICNFMMQNSYQEYRIGDLLLLKFNYLKL